MSTLTCRRCAKSPSCSPVLIADRRALPSSKWTAWSRAPGSQAWGTSGTSLRASSGASFTSLRTRCLRGPDLTRPAFHRTCKPLCGWISHECDIHPTVTFTRKLTSVRMRLHAIYWLESSDIDERHSHLLADSLERFLHVENPLLSGSCFGHGSTERRPQRGTIPICTPLPLTLSSARILAVSLDGMAAFELTVLRANAYVPHIPRPSASRLCRTSSSSP